MQRQDKIRWRSKGAQAAPTAAVVTVQLPFTRSACKRFSMLYARDAVIHLVAWSGCIHKGIQFCPAANGEMGRMKWKSLE